MIVYVRYDFVDAKYLTIWVETFRSWSENRYSKRPKMYFLLLKVNSLVSIAFAVKTQDEKEVTVKKEKKKGKQTSLTGILFRSKRKVVLQGIGLLACYNYLVIKTLLCLFSEFP